MSEELKTVGSDFMPEQKRCRELLDVYRSIPTGAVGAAIIERVIREADEAWESTDPVRILRAYKAMKECE